MQLTELRAYLETLPYDKYYQDINCIGFRGYSESYKTWDNIKNEIDWKGKKVADVGCFHGYFSFKIAHAGATVIGFDNNEDVLKTTDIINELESNIITTRLWNEEPIPESFDVALFLNVLHHFKDPDKVLREIKCDVAVFEANVDEEELIQRHFKIMKCISSHRENRYIFITQKILNLERVSPFPEGKVFVTGIYGSGKTEYAKSYSKYSGLKYIDFDMYFSYSKDNINLKASPENNLFNVLSDRFIIDAIPFSNVDGNTNKFIQYAKENDLRIVCCVCPDRKAWKKRMLAMKQYRVGVMDYVNYYIFYYNVLPKYFDFKIDFYDTCIDEYITRGQMYERINWIKPLVTFIEED